MTRPRRRSRGGVGAVLIGALFVYLGDQIGQAHRDAVEGARLMRAMVIDTSVERVVDHRPEQGERVTFYPRVTYSYRIDGSTYRNDAIWPATSTGGEASWAKDFLRDFPVGAQVGGWYQPDSPEQAFLIKGRPWLSWMAMAMGAVFVVIGVVDMLRRRR